MNQFANNIEEMKKLEPVIEVLTNPGIAQRHWVQIEKVLKMEIIPEIVTLNDFLDKNIEEKFAKYDLHHFSPSNPP